MNQVESNLYILYIFFPSFSPFSLGKTEIFGATPLQLLAEMRAQRHQLNAVSCAVGLEACEAQALVGRMPKLLEDLRQQLALQPVEVASFEERKKQFDKPTGEV